MNVLKIVIVSLVFIKLFAVDLYVPKDYNISLKNTNLLKIKRYKNLNEVDFNQSFVMISYNNIPLIFKKKLLIIEPIGEIKESIFTNEKSLKNIKTIINLDFISKILLDSVNGKYRSVKGSFKDFLNGKVDAIVYNNTIPKKGIYKFPLKIFGLDFNKYFIVSSRKFIMQNEDLMAVFEDYFNNNFDVKKNLIYKTLLISSLYLHKKLNLSKILYKNYILIKEKNKKVVIVGITPNWPPFDIYKNGTLYGIGVDFWKLIAKKTHINYVFKIEKTWSELLKDFKLRKIDLTINTSETADRKKFAIFSKPYVSFPLAIICRSDENFNSIKDIKSIAVGKNFTAEKLMKKHYPYLNYIETKNVFDALKLVENRKAQCAVDILPVILWTINKNHLMNLQIAFETPFKFYVQIMIRNDYKNLQRKINKAIESISPLEKQKIINKYISQIIIKKNDSYYLYYFLIIVIVIILIVFYILLVKNKKIQKEAYYDELTKIYNRRGVLNEVKNKSPGNILFFDIDHFKKINDTYGHDFGDFVLEEIGKILKNTFRKSDIIGRWGGEEFIVVLPETKYEDALKLAEKLRKIIENHDFDGVRITISIGVSEYNGNFEESLKKADEALYNAKNSGRNQVKGKR